MIEDLIKELQEIEALQAKIEARLQKLSQRVKTNKANKNERNQYKSLRGSLQSAAQRARSVKTSISQIRINTSREMKRRMSNLMKTGQTFGDMRIDEIKIRFTGPFDSLPGEAYWQKAAKSAGNRIEMHHPGFFEKYKELDDFLQIIWEVYASFHKYYSYKEDVFSIEEDRYEDLKEALDRNLDYLHKTGVFAE